jgi:hypothetical protein
MTASPAQQADWQRSHSSSCPFSAPGVIGDPQSVPPCCNTSWLLLHICATKYAGQCGPGLFRAIFTERSARSAPLFLKGMAPVLPWPTRCFERDARSTPQAFKGIA